ncbi:helix-turn-helix transcriptional regulator [Enterococcus faecium]|uniref:helix-turn-helix domain-containing protein n=1 Tax=Enterococcus faecium TaxID=1352 RepID=UPI001F1CC09F|nr:helix-turn-helix transcriptional regulator [Enterococcus faecium]EKZ0201727.1 helix-turn-helix transcriptional regulator [Enterococcus faecalis]MCF8636744.1 helix-turn-helix domain-containing protein [Enterococcus faecium]HAQ5747071.1 helix-turn-helix transcriptional regulator [Enterococcus faecium]
MEKLNATKENIFDDNPQAVEWTLNRLGNDDNIYEVKSGKELKMLIDTKNEKPFGVIVPSKTNTKWWEEYIGSHNPLVYFLKGEPAKALVLFNVIVMNDDIVHPIEMIEKLGTYGLTQKDIAEKLGVNKMRIHRIGKYDEQFKNNISLFKDLYKLLKQVEFESFKRSNSK